MFPKMVGFPPKSSILIGFSIINHPFWSIPYFLETPIYWILLSLSECWILGLLDEENHTWLKMKFASIQLHPKLRTRMWSQDCGDDHWESLCLYQQDHRGWSDAGGEVKICEDHQVFGLERSLGCSQHARAWLSEWHCERVEMPFWREQEFVDLLEEIKEAKRHRTWYRNYLANVSNPI